MRIVITVVLFIIALILAKCHDSVNDDKIWDMIKNIDSHITDEYRSFCGKSYIVLSIICIIFAALVLFGVI